MSITRPTSGSCSSRGYGSIEDGSSNRPATECSRNSPARLRRGCAQSKFSAGCVFAMPAFHRTVSWPSASASMSATSSPNRRTFLAMASISRHGSRVWPSPTGSASRMRSSSRFATSSRTVLRTSAINWPKISHVHCMPLCCDRRPFSDATPVAPPRASAGLVSGRHRPPRLSSIVLPFTNLSDDRDDQYFADAITDDVTTDLSRIPGMTVISSNTAFTYKDRRVDTRQIGRDLSVRYVFSGSVRRAANRARVNVQLIDAETDAHLWADRFDYDASELLAL